jgi:hypothetical protein
VEPRLICAAQARKAEEIRPLFRLKMTVSRQDVGLGQADQLSQVRRLAAALDQVGETQSLGGLAGGGISALIDYDLAGDSGIAAHRSVLEEARHAAEQAGFYLIDAAVSQLVSRAVEGTLVGAVAGMAGGAKANNPWILLGAGAVGGMVGNLVGSDIKSELPYLLGVTDQYGRWWLQELAATSTQSAPFGA